MSFACRWGEVLLSLRLIGQKILTIRQQLLEWSVLHDRCNTGGVEALLIENPVRTLGFFLKY
jgi:hypothetical protein